MILQATLNASSIVKIEAEEARMTSNSYAFNSRIHLELQYSSKLSKFINLIRSAGVVAKTAAILHPALVDDVRRQL